MKTISLLCVTFAMGVCSAGCADTCEIVDEVKSSVKSGWRSLEKYAGNIVALREERKTLPAYSSWKYLWLNTNKSDQDEKIRAQLERVRELLLSTNA